jgi:hypothetical protein
MRNYAKIAPQFWIGNTGRKLRDAGPEALLVVYIAARPTIRPRSAGRRSALMRTNRAVPAQAALARAAIVGPRSAERLTTLQGGRE